MSSLFGGNGIRWNEGMRDDERNDFLQSRGDSKQLSAGQYFQNGKYRVVAGNANEAGWGAQVPPGYEAIGSTSQSTWTSHPKYGSMKKQVGENLLILRRTDNQQPGTQAQQAPKPAPVPEVRRASDALTDARKRWQNDQDSAGDGSIHFKPTGNPYADAANYGNEATDDYNRRFIPSLNRQSELEAREIGETGNFHLSRFAGNVPQLGDPKEMFEYYKNKIG